MTHKSIGYHTRLWTNNTVKVTGGSFGGAIDMETVNRLVNAHFTITVKPSGRPVFVDREGNDVMLYLSVDPERTEKGIEALIAWREEQRQREEAERAKREQAERAKREQLDAMIDELGLEEAHRRLKGE